MNDSYTQLITVFLSFFAIMNPIANTAVFAGLTKDSDRATKIKIASKALIVTFLIILSFSLLGKAIFHLFGITLSALRITGGILVFLVGYHMLKGSGSSLHKANHDDETDISISPLAVPLLAGPGTIATAMNHSASEGITGIVTTVSVFAVLCLITFFCFTLSSNILSLIGKSGLNIITRLMGLILSVIGTQMFIEGVTGVIKAYL